MYKAICKFTKKKIIGEWDDLRELDKRLYDLIEIKKIEEGIFYNKEKHKIIYGELVPIHYIS